MRPPARNGASRCSDMRFIAKRATGCSRRMRTNYSGNSLTAGWCGASHMCPATDRAFAWGTRTWLDGFLRLVWLRASREFDVDAELVGNRQRVREGQLLDVEVAHARAGRCRPCQRIACN